MLLQKELCYRIQGCIYEVYRQLGHGFLEKVYERALRHELEQHGLQVSCQVPYRLFYKEVSVGEYFADMVVEETVLLELKADAAYSRAWEAQLMNYLHASHLKVGLLANFSYPKATVKRFVI